MKISISKLSEFKKVSLLFLAYSLFITAGCVSHQNVTESIKEKQSYNITRIQGKPVLQIPEKEATWLTVARATTLYPLYSSAYHMVIVEPSGH